MNKTKIRQTKVLLAKKRKALVRRIKIYILIFIFLSSFVVIIYATYHQAFQLVSFDYRGNKAYKSKVLTDAYYYLRLNDSIFHIMSPYNIFLIDSNDLRQFILAKYPEIESLQITKSYKKRSIRLDLKLREILFLLCSKEKCLASDKEGVLFDIYENSKISYLPKYKHENLTLKPGLKIDAEIVQAIVQARAKLGKEFKGIEFKNNNEYRVFVNDYYLKVRRLSEISDVLKKFNYIKSFFKDKNLEYVDLRFGKKVFYKEKGEKSDKEQ